MAETTDNVIAKLRQLSIEELRKKRKNLVRNCKVVRWAVLVLMVAVAVAVLTRDHTEVAFCFAIAAVFLVGVLSWQHKIWFIDLVLAEKTEGQIMQRPSQDAT